MTTFSVPNGRARLSVEVSGSGPVDVLLLHAGVTDHRSWAPLRAVLADRGRVIGFDARGFGDTTYEYEPGWSPVTDAVAVLDAVGAGRAVVVGASMGGATALDLTLAHPERVAALVLVGAAVSGAPAPGSLDAATAALDEAGDAALARGDRVELNRVEAALWLDGPGRPGRVGEAVRALFLDMNARALAAADPGEQNASAPAWDRLEEIGVPTLVLVGEHDLEHVRRNARHLARAVPGAELVELPGVAHLPHLEGDEATLHAIARAVDARS
ncbi:MAG: alpha/beta fold hydrolase [Marmoricola sp.]